MLWFFRLLALWRGASTPTPFLQPILQELIKMSETFNAELSRLRDDVAAQGTVIASATAAFRGLAAQLVAAEANAKSAGATDAQMFSVAAVRQTLEANTASLAAAIPANTPSATEQAATPPVVAVVMPVETPATTPIAPAPSPGDTVAVVPVTTP